MARQIALYQHNPAHLHDSRLGLAEGQIQSQSQPIQRVPQPNNQSSGRDNSQSFPFGSAGGTHRQGRGGRRLRQRHTR